MDAKKAAFDILIDDTNKRRLMSDQRAARTAELLSSTHATTPLKDPRGLDISSTSSCDEAMPRFSASAQTSTRPPRHESSTRISQRLFQSSVGDKHVSDHISATSATLHKQHESPNLYSATERDSLSGAQLHQIKQAIRDYCVSDLRPFVMEDIKAQLSSLNDKGYLPSTSSPSSEQKDSEPEFQLYEAQIRRDRSFEKAKIANMLNFTALGISWFCQSMKFDAIKTNQLPETVRQSIKNGDYDDTLDNCSMYIRGTVLENPLFSCVLKFAENIGTAHQKEMSKQLADMERDTERRENDNFVNLSKLKSLRGWNPANLPSSSPALAPRPSIKKAQRATIQKKPLPTTQTRDEKKHTPSHAQRSKPLTTPETDTTATDKSVMDASDSNTGLKNTSKLDTPRNDSTSRSMIQNDTSQKMTSQSDTPQMNPVPNNSTLSETVSDTTFHSNTMKVAQDIATTPKLKPIGFAPIQTPMTHFSQTLNSMLN